MDVRLVRYKEVDWEDCWLVVDIDKCSCDRNKNEEKFGLINWCICFPYIAHESELEPIEK